jgi:hypothetical protein
LRPNYKKPASAGFLLGVWFTVSCGRLTNMRLSVQSIAATLLFCASMVQAQGLWRGIDADGITVYSDHALPGVRELPAPDVIPNFSTVSGFRSAEGVLPSSQALSPAVPDPADASTQATTLIEIMNPQDQATIRNNRGEVAVDFEISNQVAGQVLRLQLWLDGRLAMESAPDQRNFLLRDVPRGTHQLELRALLTEGAWHASPAHTVFLHRASRLH